MDDSSKHKVLAVGEATDNGFKLIAANSSGAVFQDIQGNFVTVKMNNEISATFNHDRPAGETISLNEHNQYIANIFINDSDTAIPAIVDTGANLVTLSGETAVTLGLDYKKEAAKINVSTASEDTNGYKIILNTIKLGSISLSNIDAIILEGSEPDMILIGMSFLKQLDLRYSGDKLEIKLHTTNTENNQSSPTTSTFAPPPAAVKSSPSKEESNSKPSPSTTQPITILPDKPITENN